METSRLIRAAGFAAIVGGLCMMVLDLSTLISGAADQPYRVTLVGQITEALFLVGKVLSVIAIPGLYLFQAHAAGRFGLFAFLAAQIGSAMMIGSDWSSVFIAPILEQAVPGLSEQPPTLLMTGFLLNYGLEVLGWLLFGIATFRAGVFPRPAAAILAIGTLLPLVGPSWIFVIWYAALIWMGSFVLRRPSGAHLMASATA